MNDKNEKVAIIHDWLVTYRGGEKVLEAISELYPNAPIYTLFYNASKMPENLKQRQIIFPKWLNRFRFIRKFLLPILPSMIESFDLSEYTLIISSSSCVAKGVIPNPDSKHLCYLHSPMRYIWDQRFIYFNFARKFPLLSLFINKTLNNLRIWDSISNHRVDKFLSNSDFVGKRVKKYYHRTSSTLHPPINLKRINEKLAQIQIKKENYYIILGALVSYKRFDLAIEAFNKNKKELLILGSGPELKNLRKTANSNIKFYEKLEDKEVYKHLSSAKALIFPGTEDFGMTAIESFACGTPVIAHKSGGALDYIQDSINGLFFEESTSENLNKAIEIFEKIIFSESEIKKTAKRFSKEQFQEKMRQEVRNLLDRE